MNFKKNDITELKMTDLTVDGTGIGKAEGFAFFVPDTAPGDLISMRVLKLKKSYGYGKIEKIIEPSPCRTTPPCSVFNRCGGCSLQHMTYEAQLEFKQNLVKNTLIRVGGLPESTDFRPILAAENPFYYRNKGQYPVAEIDGKAQTGFFAQRSHRLVPFEEGCLINQPTDTKIINAVINFMNEKGIKAYNEETAEGTVRHILVRTAVKTGEVMVCIVINADDLPRKEELSAVLQGFPSVTTAVLNINKKKTNVILGAENKVLFGKGYITDYIFDLKFKISPLSFFQVNPKQTEKLYQAVLDFADLKGNENVFDLFCGIGTISLLLAGKAGKVTGIEISEQAISDAKANAAANNISNAEFFAAPAEVFAVKQAEIAKPDLVVVDPPRKGCAPELLDALLKLSPEKIIYVSCNPSTLARDLTRLTQAYSVLKVQPVDMFPNTPHIETVVLLSQQKTTEIN
ncbi:MAG: 23S rRNA (uracil(1939)-C(5))-methyltransferase RlmD [Clostridiales bacterium]|nr:23S rRNA (uracil(1939)-C(5))-methyltransferase RlmD [Clostridiales bacterium]